MKISIELGNWQYNAGVVGLYSILRENNEESIKIENNILYFDSQELENFDEKYFNYLIKVYKKGLSWYKIISFEDRLNYIKDKILNEELNEIEFEKYLEDINNYVKDVLKKYIKSNSYISTYDFIKSDLNILKFEKELNIIQLKKNEKISDKRNEILEVLNKLLKVIEYFKLKDAKKYVGAKNIIYTVIKNAWDGVSFLNPQTKEKDIYIDMKKYFIIPALEYLNEEKSKYKYNCFICERKIKNFDNDFSFLVNTGFDTARKTSHVWNFINDVAMCPICKLVYSCIPAGFTYLYGNGLFVNSNTNMQELVRINQSIKLNIYSEDKMRDIYKLLVRQLREKEQYELEDIQLVRFENGKYYFNILSKKMIKVIKDSKKEFEIIEKDSFKERNEILKLNDEVLKHLLNNENLFTLIHRVLYSKISIKDSNYIAEYSIYSMIKINFRMLQGAGYMEAKEIDIVSRGRDAGKKLKEKYEQKGVDHKLQGICYRILNGLKTNNISMVLDTIFNCYLYCDMQVPKIVTEMMNDNEIFKEIGYAFVGGLLSIKYDGKAGQDIKN